MAEKDNNNDKSFGDHMKEKAVGYITAALGLVAGLAWNDAIKTLIDSTFPMQRSGLMAKFIYASVITIVVVVVGFYLARLASANIIRIRRRKKK